MFTLQYTGPYGKGSMIFDNPNSAHYWTDSMARTGNIRFTLRRLCKRHADMGSSEKHGKKCCKVIREG